MGSNGESEKDTLKQCKVNGDSPGSGLQKSSFRMTYDCSITEEQWTKLLESACPIRGAERRKRMRSTLGDTNDSC